MNRRLSRIALAISSFAVLPQTLWAEEETLPYDVLFVGRLGQDRAGAFESYLRPRVESLEMADRGDFQPEDAKPFDVVLLDWPQGVEEPCPLGTLEDWDTPTVLLGSAGLRVATAWDLKGWFG